VESTGHNRYEGGSLGWCFAFERVWASRCCSSSRRTQFDECQVCSTIPYIRHVAIFLLFVPVGLCGLGLIVSNVIVVGYVIEDLIIAKRAQTADAVVLSVRRDISCANVWNGAPTCSPVYIPKVRFTTARGERVDAEAVDSSSDESRVNVGRSLKVDYDPLNPHHVKASRWLNTTEDWLLLALVPGPSICLLLLGLRSWMKSTEHR
jgi:hypothetical protein